MPIYSASHESLQPTHERAEGVGGGGGGGGVVEEEGPIFQAAQSLSAHQEGEDAHAQYDRQIRGGEQGQGALTTTGRNDDFPVNSVAVAV
jgi:hypothetical protein